MAFRQQQLADNLASGISAHQDETYDFFAEKARALSVQVLYNGLISAVRLPNLHATSRSAERMIHAALRLDNPGWLADSGLNSAVEQFAGTLQLLVDVLHLGGGRHTLCASYRPKLVCDLQS